MIINIEMRAADVRDLAPRALAPRYLMTATHPPCQSGIVDAAGRAGVRFDSLPQMPCRAAVSPLSARCEGANVFGPCFVQGELNLCSASVN